MKHLEQIKKIINKYNGLISAKILKDNNIPTWYLYYLYKKNKLEKHKIKGFYVHCDYFNLDEEFTFQSKHKNVIVSHLNALYYWNLTDHHIWLNHFTTSNKSIKSEYKIYNVNKKLLNLGVVTIKNQWGLPIKIYNMERTLIDIYKDRKNMIKEIYLKAWKTYLLEPIHPTNIKRLLYYAKKFKVQYEIKAILNYLGVWEKMRELANLK
ncbi:type IV toxin-antitoxin system AbiEi family antitoxin domain-containing protein [Mycoplasma sp. 1012]